jgi:hypothetical protein
MRANRAYELRVRRGHRGPAFLAGPDAVDTVEVVEIASGEVALFWDLQPRQTGRFARALRRDLAQLEAGEFLSRWKRYQTR